MYMYKFIAASSVRGEHIARAESSQFDKGRLSSIKILFDLVRCDTLRVMLI